MNSNALYDMNCRALFGSSDSETDCNDDQQLSKLANNATAQHGKQPLPTHSAIQDKLERLKASVTKIQGQATAVGTDNNFPEG